MAVLVTDASVALAWALPDEISIYADAVLKAVGSGVLHAPEIWPREVANGLVLAVRRGRITTEQRAKFISALQILTIESIMENRSPRSPRQPNCRAIWVDRLRGFGIPFRFASRHS
jgi:hypothetical protein